MGNRVTRTEQAIIAGLCALLILFGSLAGCQFDAPSPTPTPTRTPRLPTLSPTSWPTPTPTSLPTATPTTQPTVTPTPVLELQLPPEAIVPQGYPPLPADLYFRRDGRLWRWPAAGGALEPLTLASDAPVQEYDLTLDGQSLAYRTDAGQLYFLELSSAGAVPYNLSPEEMEKVWIFRLSPDGRYVAYQTHSRKICLLDQVIQARHCFAAEAGWQFQFTSDGRYLVYLALGVYQETGGRPPGLAAGQRKPPAGGKIDGTFFAIDVQSLDQPMPLGICGAPEVNACNGFALSPDGSQVAYADHRGIWRSSIPAGEPQLWFPNEGERGPVIRNLAWSPDGRSLLVERGHYEGSDLAILDVGTNQMWELPDTFCYVGCRSEHHWTAQGLWVAMSGEYARNQVYVARMSESGELQISYWLLPTETPQVCPEMLHLLPDGRLAFVHQACITMDSWEKEGLPPGIFALSAEGALEQLVPLPAELPACPASDLRCRSNGTVSWSRDGTAFLYLDNFRSPAMVGLTDGSALWDVRELLVGATDFFWGRSSNP